MAEHEKVTRGEEVLDLELREGVAMFYVLSITHDDDDGETGAQGTRDSTKMGYQQWSAAQGNHRLGVSGPRSNGGYLRLRCRSDAPGAQATLGRNILVTTNPVYLLPV